MLHSNYTPTLDDARDWLRNVDDRFASVLDMTGLSLTDDPDKAEAAVAEIEAAYVRMLNASIYMPRLGEVSRNIEYADQLGHGCKERNIVQRAIKELMIYYVEAMDGCGNGYDVSFKTLRDDLEHLERIYEINNGGSKSRVIGWDSIK